MEEQKKENTSLKENIPYLRNVERWKINAVYLFVYDAIAIAFAYFFVLFLRFDFEFSHIPANYLGIYRSFIPYYIAITLALFHYFRLYRSIWRFASYTELYRITLATLVSGVLNYVLVTFFYGGMPISYYIVGLILQFLLVLVPRFVYRFVRLVASTQRHEKNAPRVMIVGAGSAGQMLLRDLRSASELNGKAVCFIDDDHNKWGREIDGVPVVGGRDDILLSVDKYQVDTIFIAMPSAPMQQRRDILNICKETHCKLKNLPGMYQFVLGDIKISAMQEVKVEDLLGRDAIKVNMEEIYNYIAGKTILVTGGGGSIGSELCRQIAGHKPKQLIIFDIYENNAHAIGLELRDKYPDLDLQVLIGSVRDSARLRDVFSTYHPQIVYHAAAHKHVPLMEDSPREAIKNNALGTYKTAYAAMLYGVERFVLISTDKAVNPTNIMGASKRLCEMIIQTFDRKIKAGQAADLPLHSFHEAWNVNGQPIALPEQIKTEFVAVRFGNVLGSNGSVVPRFKEQIQRGGPVTVTHPDIIRYFMTIPEAVSLVMQAGTYAHGGEIFVLDMGEPVKIDTLARNMIKLSGYTPDKDIMIEYTGLRPGEKLYEEKLMAEEGMSKTKNDLIHIGKPLDFDSDRFLQDLDELEQLAYGEEHGIRAKVQEIVTTYHPA